MRTPLALLALLAGLANAQTTDAPVAPKTSEEQELDVVDFQHVKDVLRKDGLMQEVGKKKEQVKRIGELRAVESKKRSSWPSEEEFWPLAAQWWLVKNAATLKWDFERPDYGLDESFAQVLKTVGLAGKKFRLLALDAPSPAHLALPWTGGEYCLLFSVPFVRSMDLSKLEISLLLLEDVLRDEEGVLKAHARPAKLKELAGSTFVDKAPDLSPLVDVGRAYSDFISEKGFTFQQQFKLTKRMDALLKPRPELWNAYVRLLGKIDRLTKGPAGVHSDYAKLYPSPEMQIRWLAPAEKEP
jgi:hypothetical protein